MRNIVLIFLVLTLLSCRDSHENTRSYYRFTETDKNFVFPSVKQGDKKVFRNQFGSQLTFTVNSAYNGIGTEASSQMFAGKYFDYDLRSVSMSGGNITIAYDFKRWPDNYDLALQKSPDLTPSHLVGRVNHSHYNKLSGTSEEINYSANPITMEVNGIFYTQVLVFDSGNSQPLFTYLTVNKLYFDRISGLIGYDEINGDQWRLVP